jgi:hypothetical protein
MLQEARWKPNTETRREGYWVMLRQPLTCTMVALWSPTVRVDVTASSSCMNGRGARDDDMTLMMVHTKTQESAYRITCMVHCMASNPKCKLQADVRAHNPSRLSQTWLQGLERILSPALITLMVGYSHWIPDTPTYRVGRAQDVLLL